MSGCSNSGVIGEPSLAGGSVSKTTESEARSTSKSAEHNLSSFFVLTYFDLDSAALNLQTTKTLDSAVDKFAKNPFARVVSGGHADEIGTREYNLALGHRKASAVADYMLFKGIDGLRIKKVPYGKERPLLKGSKEEAWAKNRRVEINDE
ncbi:OmpA family protein [Alphaproteobacteria bacterium]|nr:OmpA family protein [Alphaproteobacteria bacterium]